MRKKLNLTIEKEVYNFLKQKKLNISRYVEKLIIKDLFRKSQIEQSSSLVLTRVRIPSPALHSNGKKFERAQKQIVFGNICKKQM